MKQYEEYKQTDTSWVSAVPITWDIKKIGELFELRNEKVSDKDYQPISVTKKRHSASVGNSGKNQRRG